MTFKITHQRIDSQQNSWYLRTGQVHHFLCRCGQVDQLHSAALIAHHPSHACSNCGNRYYLDSDMFLNNPKVTRWSKFYWDTENLKNDEGWIVSTYAMIPVPDYTIQKIRLKKIVLAAISLSFVGKHNYKKWEHGPLKKHIFNGRRKAEMLEETIEAELMEKLSSFVLASPVPEMDWMAEQDLPESVGMSRIKMYAFFLRNPHLKEYEFFYWKSFDVFRKLSASYPSVKEMLACILNFRQEKSIKRACYISYERSMKQLGYYDPTTDYIFAHQISDRNFLLQLISMDAEVKARLWQELRWDDIETFFVFLKEHYTQREITALFQNIGNSYYLRDVVQMLRGGMVDFIREHFQKVRPSIEKLHDEFIYIGNLGEGALEEKRIFEYHKNDLMAQTTKEGLEYRLPETITILFGWSRHLHNCMYGYSQTIHEMRSIIYGVFREKELLYAIEIKNDRIVQALGRYNQPIEKEDRRKIDLWFEEFYLKGWLREVSE